MASKRNITGTICLLGAGLGSLAAAVVTPVRSSGSGAEQIAAAAAHPTRMAWATVLDLGILLLVPALLYVGRLAGASRLGRAGFGLSFIGVLIGCGYLVALDPLVSAGAHQGDRTAAAALIDGYSGTGIFLAALVVFMVGHVVGFVLLGVALARARVVPVWAAAALALWPAGEIAGDAAGVSAVSVVGYALLAVGLGGCAAALIRDGRRPAPAVVRTPTPAEARS
jgi:hypothetical protein